MDMYSEFIERFENEDTTLNILAADMSIFVTHEDDLLILSHIDGGMERFKQELKDAGYKAYVDYKDFSVFVEL